MTTVLVTGGSGFIGTWGVRELLARQMRAVVLDDIRQVLPGWEPTSLADGVARTIAYYRQAKGKV